MSEKQSELTPREKIRSYMREHYDLTPEERERRFRDEIAPLMGPADEATLAFRQRCKELGAPIVFGCPNMSNEEIIRILEAPETQRILNDPSLW